MAMKIKPARGTKTRIETVKNELADYQMVYATDTKELGVKNTDGTVSYMANEKKLNDEVNNLLSNINQIDEMKQEKLVSGVNIKTLGNQSLLGSGNISIPSTAEFASKQELAPYISSKNLGGPDLKGKEYLGDGVYRLYDLNSITFDYNVYSGIYSLVGTPTDNIFELIKPELVGNQTYTLSAYKISGTTNDVLFSWYYEQDIAISFPNQTTQTKTLPNYNAQMYALKDSVYDIQFKLQIEKGTEATPFAVPAGVIPYIPEVKTEFDSKLDKVSTSSTYNRAYVKLANGTQGLIDITDVPVANTIAFRHSGGRLEVGNAFSDYDAIPKGQADGRYAKSDWTLIATNSTAGGDSISLPTGTKEILITSGGFTTVHLPNITGASGISIGAWGMETVKTGAKWRATGGTTLIKEWDADTVPSITPYRIYGR